MNTIQRTHLLGFGHVAKLGALAKIVLGSVLALGCAVAVEEAAPETEGAVDSTTEGIKSGQTLSYYTRYADTEVAVGGCTGTIIGEHHVLTGFQCNISVGATVRFYNGSNTIAETRKVAQRYAQSGVTLENGLQNNAGKFADWAVLYLDGPIPESTRIAKLGTRWPGNGVSMAEVGRGNHDGVANPNRVLKYRMNRSYSASDAEGHVLFEGQVGDPGDAGGPFLAPWLGFSEVQAILWGQVWEWGTRDKATSVPHHYTKIARAIGYNYSTDRTLTGTLDLTLDDDMSENECFAWCLPAPWCKGITYKSSTKTCKFWRDDVALGGTATGTNAIRKLPAGGTGNCNTTSGGYCRI
jgi:hypothetical protein